MKTKAIFFAIIFVVSLRIDAQNLFPENGVVFQDDIIPRVDIIFPDDSLAVLVQPGNEWSNYLWHAKFVFSAGEISDTLENVGFRLRGNTSRVSDKKSFKVSFNTYEPGRKFYGLEKLNLNGEHNDPSISRSKICWDLLKNMQIPAPRANHVDLYINGDYFGLYVNVEHIDEEFVESRFGNKSGNLYKCLWPATLDYKGADPDLYKEIVSSNRRTYDLKTNTDIDDYSDLANFIDILNNTPIDELECELEKVFNVNDYLKVIAFDVLTGNWDGPLYNKNNFYLYKNQFTGKFEYIPYDLDNTLGIDWFGIDWGERNVYDWAKHGEQRPLYWRILDISKYRDEFTYYMKTFLFNIFNIDNLGSKLDSIKSMILPSAEMDIYRTLDYGFSMDDFENSFEVELDYSFIPYGLKSYILTRIENSFLQLDNQNINPIITSPQNSIPLPGSDIIFSAKVNDFDDISSVEICYSIDDIEYPCFQIFDDGNSYDIVENDDIYSGSLSDLPEVGALEYYFKATNSQGLTTIEPNCGYRTIQIGGSEINLSLNEIMAKNTTTISDQFGEFDDWIEIYNSGNRPYYLGDLYLTDDIDTPKKWQLPNSWINPDNFFLIWADKDEEQGDNHASFKLSSGGESVWLFDNNSNIIDGFNFDQLNDDEAFGRLPDGGESLENIFPTPNSSNMPLSQVDVSKNEAIIIYPNPVNDFLIIEFSGIEKYKIFNSSGILVGSSIISSNKSQIEIGVSNLPQGIYYLFLMGSENTFSKRFILYN